MVVSPEAGARDSCPGHSYAALWASGEVLVIGTVFAIYWWGHSRRCVRTATRASASGGEVAPLKVSIRHAIALILEEHKDWYLLVQPHRLHLA